MSGLQNQNMNAPLPEGALEQTLSVKICQKNSPSAPQASSVGSLSCYMNSDAAVWHKTDFPIDKYKISIASHLAGAQRRASSDIDALRYDHFWFVFSSDNIEGLSFNGLKTFQDVIVKNSTCFIMHNKQKALLTTRTPDSVKTEELKPGAPEAYEYGIENERGEFRYPSTKSLLIGSNQICDIVVEGKPFSAMICTVKNSLILINIAMDPIQINGEDTKTLTTELNHNDQLTIGEYQLTVKLPGIPFNPLYSQLPDATLALLDINSSGEVLEKIFLPIGKALTFGRGSVSDVVINDKSISRKHSQLIIYEDHALVLDCYSKNGTFINENKIGKGRARLGDLITFANKSYVLSHYNE